MHALKKLLLTALVALLPAVAIADKSNDTLVAAFERELRTLDGNYSNNRENDIVGLLTDDALFSVDPTTSEAVPLLAASHKFLDDTTLQVDIRDDVLFHDGSKVTAEDVAYTYNWLINPKSQNNFLDRFTRWLERAEVAAPNRVVFHMKEPYAMVLYDLAMYSKIRKVGTYDDPSGPDGVNLEAQTRELNGTGPYRVVSFSPGQQLELTRFEDYRQNSPKGIPPIKNITVRMIPDLSTQAAEVMSGGVNWTFAITSDIATSAASTGQAQLVTGPSMRTFYISIDAAGEVKAGGPLTKKLVRQALIHALDRESIVKNLLGEGAQVLNTPCVTVQFGCDEAVVTKYPYDPERAKALLAEAGYAEGFDMELWAARDRPVVEAIVDQWQQVGINATLHYVKGPTLSEARGAKNIPAEFASSGSFGIPDAGALLPDRLGTGSDRNFSGDAALAETIMDAVGTYDEQARKVAFDKALKTITEEAYWVPLYTEAQNFLMTTDVSYGQPGDGMPRLFMARWK